MPHTSVRYWDLQYFFDPRHFEEDRSLRLPRPDIIAVNGPIAKNTHLASGYPTNEIFEVEALRFSYLNKYILRHNQRHKLSNPSHFKLLVLGDYHAINNEIMMNILSELDQKFLPILDITVKPHPACKFCPLSTLTYILKSLMLLLVTCLVSPMLHSPVLELLQLLMLTVQLCLSFLSLIQIN